MLPPTLYINQLSLVTSLILYSIGQVHVLLPVYFGFIYLSTTVITLFRLFDQLYVEYCCE